MKDIDFDKLRQYRLFIATPMYGGKADLVYLMSLLELHYICIKEKIPIVFSFTANESLVPRARNLCAAKFLKSDCTHLLFLDADVHVKAMDVLQMLMWDKEVIGLPFAKKFIDWNHVGRAAGFPHIKGGEMLEKTGCRLNNVNHEITDYNEFFKNEPIEVNFIGCGCMLVQRDVFLKFKDCYPDLAFVETSPDVATPEEPSVICHSYFHVGILPELQQYISEDFAFCYYWKQAGGTIWILPWVTTGHMGTYEYQCDFRHVINTQ